MNDRSCAGRIAPMLQRAIRRTRYQARVAWGRTTWRQRPTPEFLIIGAQRAGTTSLSQDLAQHAQIAIPLTKEIHYFDQHHTKGLPWYRAHFKTRSERRGRVTGEATTDYLFHPHAPYWAAEELPETRFIVILRNPVDRAVSHWSLMSRIGVDDLSLDDALDAEERRIGPDRQRLERDPHDPAWDYFRYSYVARGRYVDQLERWLGAIDRNRFLILRAEDYHAFPTETFGRITDFLDLDEWAPPTFAAEHGATKGPVPDHVRQRLTAHFKPFNERLEALLGTSMGW